MNPQKPKRSKAEVVARILCKLDGGSPSERVDYGVGRRWGDYETEANRIVRALAKHERKGGL